MRMTFPNPDPGLETSSTSQVATSASRWSVGRRFGSGWVVGLWILGGGLFSHAAAAEKAAPAALRDPVRVDEKTEQVIRGALKWLASKQSPNGAWASSDMEQQHPIAITGYALMAFQAAGQLPGEGEYGKQVSLGMQYLVDSIAPDGLFGNKNNGQYMYGHGVATIALAELYGQTRSPTVRAKLDKVVKVIVSSQNNEGGWRYRPIAYQADISVTVLQVVGLRAAKNAGLDVPQATIDKAVDYVKKCYHAPTGGFSYQPGQSPGFARTAAAVYSLQVCGLYEDPMVKAGSEYLLKNFNASRSEWFTYGNFYAAPAQYMRGGETWEKWYALLKEALVKKATIRGDVAYWDPNESQLDGGRNVGAVYSTSVYTMMLAMPYHYIPLYQR
jgi:prenyltransferase beta subunit